MLLLRIVTILLSLGWLTYSVLTSKSTQNDPDTIRKGPFQWKKIGIEIPLILFVIFNILSTVFSQNVRLSVIGAYDRWEGIATALNYIVLLVLTVKLITRRYQIKWILVSLLVPCAISSVYGIAQSLGIDFMQWSVDPTKRVFACINNPVHYCAYMGMMIPVGISSLIYISSSFKRSLFQVVSKWLLFVMIGLIFYAQYLSFSRATWFGFALAMPIYFLVILGLMRTEKQRVLTWDFFLTLFGITTFYLYYIFNFHLKGLSISLILGTLIISALIGTFAICRNYHSQSLFPKLSEWIIPTLGTVGLFFAFIFNLTELSPFVEWAIRIPSLALFGFALFRATDSNRDYLSRIVIFALFATVQFVALSFTTLFLYAILVSAFFWNMLRGNQALGKEIKLWLCTILAMFGLIISVPAIPELIQTLTQPRDHATAGLQAVETVQDKLAAYKRDAKDGSARVSMWKSSVPWIKDYWLIGSGLDTIKYMYPDYRRPEYGILEGGHNFTPDRLHNEYLNNFATRGIIGSLIYYFGIIIGWYLIVLRGMVKLNKSPMKFFAVAFMTGATIYMGQVLFNFGVVATMVLFYTFMGLSWAIVTHSDFDNERIEEHS